MILLCADDYALTEGVSRAVGELAAARRLSATSALVTTPHWPAMAQRLVIHRGRIAVGLHLNLTLGAPLGPMPRFAPGGILPKRNAVLKRSLLALLPLPQILAEIRAEIERQLDAFERHLGFAPDHIDGHEHMHVLPGIRRCLIDVVVRRYPGQKPLLRNPADRRQAIAARGGTRGKALAVAALAAGFGASVRRRGIPSNDGFSGFSSFDVTVPYAKELEAAMRMPGRCHIVMCHPGHADAELAAVDPVVERRRMEYDTLMRDTLLSERIWHPARASDGPPVDWAQVGSAGDAGDAT